MGIIKKGILGGFSGKIGQVVGGNWKGIDYMRSLPASVANPRTTGQVSQRNAFKGTTQFFSLFLGSIVQVFWNGKKPAMSGYNDIVQKNIVHFNSSGVPTYSDLEFSTGPLLNENVTSVVASSISGDTTVSWSNLTGQGNADASDYVNIVLLNLTQDTRVVNTLGTARALNSAVIATPDFVSGDVVEAYVFCSRDGNNKFASDTSHSSVVVL